jgi:outer membrane protein OmpA-like peptidoglycan-associated protein
MVVLSVAALTVLGCSGTGDDPKTGSKTSANPSGKAADFPVLQSQLMTHESGPVLVQAQVLNRIAGDKITARFRVVNQGRQTVDMREALSDEKNPTGSGFFAHGLALLDAAADKAYYPLRTADGDCLCSELGDLAAGQSLEIYAVFPALPAELSKVTVQVPHTAPMVDLPIGKGDVAPVPGQQPDIGKLSLGQPIIRPIVSKADGVELSEDEIAGDKRVRLSADVLFALNKADLSPRAQALLQNLARQIDQSPGATVKIDGYTDNTGNDAINQPLSERRAQAVETRLKSLVTKTGLTYQSAGHGSADPVESNDTDEGRRRNRRVAVTFARPVQRQATPSGGSAAGPPVTWSPGGKLPAVAQGQLPDDQKLAVTVNGLHRDSSGLVSLVWTVTNNGAEMVDVAGAFDANLLQYEGRTTGGVSLLDRSAKLDYRTLRDDQGVCLCTSFAFDEKRELNPGESGTYANLFKPAPSATTVDVEIPYDDRKAVIKNVPIK